MVTIANPIYDSVFKYLMQDTRVAKLLIENLLGYPVENVVIKNNEFILIDINELKLSRVDFQAKVKISETETQLVTIELQKAFLDTEYMRFRRYLGEHYINNENCVYKTVEKIDEKTGEKYLKNKEYPNPIIQVYLLGHNLPEIDAAISKSQLKFVDLDGNIVSGVDKSLFVKSLTHQTIIVQIQKLPQKSQHKIESMLSIFNNKAIFQNKEEQTVKIEDYSDKSEEYQLMARRLQEAAVDNDVRKMMKEEDDLMRQYRLMKENERLRMEAAEKRGKEKGKEEGRAEERAKALQEKLDMAKKMKSDGMPIEVITKYTALSAEEISNL